MLAASGDTLATATAVTIPLVLSKDSRYEGALGVPEVSGTTASWLSEMRWKMAKPPRSPVACTCAEPVSTVPLVSWVVLTIQEANGASVSDNKASTCGSAPGCCGNVKESGKGLPL